MALSPQSTCPHTVGYRGMVINIAVFKKGRCVCLVLLVAVDSVRLPEAHAIWPIF